MEGAITPMALVCLKDQKDMHNVHFIPRHHTEDKLVLSKGKSLAAYIRQWDGQTNEKGQSSIFTTIQEWGYNILS